MKKDASKEPKVTVGIGIAKDGLPTGGKQKTTGTEVITKVKPTVSKELSESARGLRLSGWAKRMLADKSKKATWY